MVGFRLLFGKEEMKEHFLVIDGWYQIAGMFDTHEEALAFHQKKMQQTGENWYVATLDEYNDSIHIFANAWVETVKSNGL